MKKQLYLLFGLFLFISSCSDDLDNTQQTDLTTSVEETISINNNSADLSSRLTTKNELVSINNIASSTTISALSIDDEFEIDYTQNYAFTLKAEVESPTVNDVTVQATHVKISVSDELAFVSYNTKGNEYGGGVEIFDISDEDNPALKSQALFTTLDVSSVDYYDGMIYLAGALAASDDAYATDTPAVLVALAVNSSNEIDSVSQVIDLSSYVATDVAVDEDYIYVTSGDDGKLAIYKRGDYSLVSEVTIDDARSLGVNSDNIYVLNASDEVIQSFAKSDFIEATEISLDQTITDESKTEIDVTDSYILAALNESGLDIRNVDGSIQEHLDRPDTPDGGDDANYVTNSVSLNDELLLIGNGGAGVYVGAMVPENSDSITLLGSMDFDASVNCVKSAGDYIFVASGTEGLKIISIAIDEGLPEDIIETETCETLLDTLDVMFPENEDNRDGDNADLFTGENTLTLTLLEDSPVYLTFIDEGAGLKNSLAYYTYDAENPPTSADDVELQMLFPNASKVGEGGALTIGDRVQLGDSDFSANTVIGFCLIVSGWKNGTTVDGVYYHYTNTEWNTNETQQHVLFKESTCDDLVLCFEDIQIPGGDKDYNDIIFTVNDSEEDDNVATAFDLTGIVVK
jgi:hypothetical protein